MGARSVRRGLAVAAVLAAGLPLVGRSGIDTSNQAAAAGREISIDATSAGQRLSTAKAVVIGQYTHRISAPTRRRRTQTFDLVGATWSRTGTRDAQVEVRVHRHGRWTGWQRLAADDGGASADSPDARADHRDRLVSASPLWVGSANGVQARVVGRDANYPPASSPVHLVLVNGGHSSTDETEAAAPTELARASAPAGPIAEPTIISRAAWGADEALRHRNKGCGTPEYASTIKVGFVHHTDTPNGYSRAEVPAMIRSIYDYHVVANGWCDIGYNFLVDRFGRIWQGRYGGNDRPVIGAHTGGFNTDSFGVAMLGTFNSVSPDAAMRASVARIIAWRLGTNFRNPLGVATLHADRFDGSRYRAGTNVRFNVISGHRNADFTDCPGTLGYAALPSIRAAAMADIGAGLIAPSIGTTSLRAGSGAVLTIAARALVSESWTLSVIGPSGTVVDTVTGRAAKGAAIAASWDGLLAGVTPALAPAGRYGLILTPSTGARTGISYAAPVTVTSPVTIGGPATAAYTSTVKLAGLAPAGAAVTVSVTDQTPVVVTAGAAGKWSTTFQADQDRSWSASAVIDGVTYPTQTGTTRVAPTVTSPAPSGSTLRPGTTSFTLSGTALPAAGTVSVVALRGLIGTATVGADGTWSVQVHTASRTTLHVTDGRGVSSPSYSVVA